MNIHNEVNSDDYMILFTLLCFKTSATEYLINHINLRLSYTNSTGTLPMFTESRGTNVCSYLFPCLLNPEVQMYVVIWQWLNGNMQFY